MGLLFVVIGVGVMGAVAVAVQIGLSEARWLARRARETPRTPIAGAIDRKRARIVGTIIDGPTVIAPGSGRPCVWYQTELREQALDDRASRAHRDRGGLIFAVEDDSGRALVDASRAETIVAVDWTGVLVQGAARTAPQQAMLARGGFGGHAPEGFDVTERVLEIGDRVAVIGVGVRDSDPDGATRASGYRDLPPTLVLFAGELLLVTDHDAAMG